MIKKIFVENFKSFGVQQEIELAPITLIYGENSSGKSSIIQALMLLKQTLGRKSRTSSPSNVAITEINADYTSQYLESCKIYRNKEIVFDGGFASLGSFGLCVNGHEEDKNISIGISYDSGGCLKYCNNDDAVKIVASVVVDIGLISLKNNGSGNALNNATDDTEARIKTVTYKINDGHDIDVSFYRDEKHILVNDKTKIISRNSPQYIADVEHLSSFAGFAAAIVEKSGGVIADKSVFLKAFSEFNGKPMRPNNNDWLPDVLPLTHLVAANLLEFGDCEVSAASLASMLIETICGEYIEKIDSVSYLGPLRKPPVRVETLASYNTGTVGPTGRDTASLMVYSKEIRDNVNEWFELMQIPYVVDVSIVSDDRESNKNGISIILTDKRTNTTATPQDVGFGISQLVPIIVEGIISKSTVCVEQPETHLHPRLQAEFADFLIGTSVSAPEGCQWIVETHSEALILRIMRRIRNGVIKPSDVSVIYVDSTEYGAVAKRLELDRMGEFIDEWPDGFFEQSYDDIAGGIGS